MYSLVQNPTHQNTMVHKTEQNEKTQISMAHVKTRPRLLRARQRGFGKRNADRWKKRLRI
jgi:hypothetical protein